MRVIVAEAAALVAIGSLSAMLLELVSPAIASGPAATAAVCAAPETTPQAPPGAVTIALSDARSLLDEGGVVFIDARSRLEFVTGHIAGAINLPAGEETALVAMLPSLRAARTVVTYCEVGPNCACSDVLARTLVDAGLRDVRVIHGGLGAWIEAQYPAEAGSCSL